ncbi:MAG: Bug family tripartite tricarboxylate transporter substrate binding protein [Burkholderiales bacterium]
MDLARYASVVALIAVGLHACLPGTGHAQDAWPSRPVRVVVPSSPGGGTDVYARVLSQGLSEALKQQFVVDNRPGGSGNIGAEIVAKAAPDGYTMLVSANASIAINPVLHRKLPFDVDRDLAPVTRGVSAPLVLIIHPSVPAKSLAELVELGKREPNKIAFGSAGTGTPTFLGMRRFEEVSGARFLHIPYKGVGAAYKDLLSGEIKFMLPDVATAIPHIRSGKLTALVVNERHPLLPNTPTFAEAGFPGVEIEGFFSVLLTGGSPRPIIERLAVEVAKVMRVPAIAERLHGLALVPVFDTPDDFAAKLKKEREGWAALIKRNNIVVED